MERDFEAQHPKRHHHHLVRAKVLLDVNFLVLKAHFAEKMNLMLFEVEMLQLLIDYLMMVEDTQQDFDWLKVMMDSK